jgi:hypothetical protein
MSAAEILAVIGGKKRGSRLATSLEEVRLAHGIVSTGPCALLTPAKERGVGRPFLARHRKAAGNHDQRRLKVVMTARLPGTVRDKLHKERTPGLRHAVYDGAERHGIGVLKVKSIAQPEPHIEIWRQVSGGERQIGKVNRPQGISSNRKARRGMLHPAA